MPETPEKTAYEILGVSRTASVDDIKKRYREMARQYHPDVNQNNPTAAKQFAQISKAYKTLSDSSSRATYDAELSLQEQRVAASAARAAATAPSRSGSPPSTTRPASAPSASSPTATPAATSQGRINESMRLVGEAQYSFARGRFVEARALAEQALRLHRKNEKAYEVLGDIYRLQGKTDEAINMYSMSLQLNPRNPAVMQRLERLSRMTGGVSGPTAQRVFFDNSGVPRETPPGARPSASAPSAYPGGLRDERRNLGLFTVGFIGYSLVVLLLLYIALNPGEMPEGNPLLPIVSTWNLPLVLVMACCGSILGATMTITGAIRRIEDELIFTGLSNRKGIVAPPMGLLVVVLAVVNFYLAAFLYSVVTLLQEAFTRSMGRVFGSVLIVNFLLAWAYTPGHWQVLFWGGNIVFLCFVIGWLLGDFFRPENF